MNNDKCINHLLICVMYMFFTLDYLPRDGITMRMAQWNIDHEQRLLLDIVTLSVATKNRLRIIMG